MREERRRRGGEERRRDETRRDERRRDERRSDEKRREEKRREEKRREEKIREKTTYLSTRVLSVHQATEVKELGTLVDLGPETLLEPLFRRPQLLALAEAVEVREDADDLRKAMNLEHVEELERLHLKAEGSVHEQENEVSNLGQVDHGRGLVGACGIARFYWLSELLPANTTRANEKPTLEKAEALLLARDHGDRSLRIALERAFCVPLDQRLDQRALPNSGWSSHDHDDRWRRERILDLPVDQRHVLLLVLSVEVALHRLSRLDTRADGEGCVGMEVECGREREMEGGREGERSVDREKIREVRYRDRGWFCIHL